jgi:hypothetical protein
VASRNRFALRYGVEAVELALKMVERKAAEEVQASRTAGTVGRR